MVGMEIIEIETLRRDGVAGPDGFCRSREMNGARGIRTGGQRMTSRLAGFIYVVFDTAV